MNRRQWLLSAGAALLTAARAQGQNVVSRPVARSRASNGARRILILGGTGFIGPHFVAEALGRGAKVTLFNRGKSRPTPMPGVETLLGDRNGKLDALTGRDWDVVTDAAGYVTPH